MRCEKSGGAIGRLRGIVDQGAPAQLLERQRRIHPARVIEVAVDQPVEEMADVEPAFPAGGVGVANDVDRAAVAQQVIELRPIGELVDPREVDQQQPTRIVGGGVEAIKIDVSPRWLARTPTRSRSLPTT